ncbi:hypothetical protein KA005_60200, partial [bacterium]|nr:hypothetical protein [bacterium]
MKSNKPIKKVCIYCKKEFETYYGQQKYCSETCKGRYLQKVKHPIDKIRECRNCGKEFKVHGKQGNKQHCSDECARESARKS